MGLYLGRNKINPINNVYTGTKPDAKLITKDISMNGVFNAKDDGADGYSKVTVNVPISLQSKTVTPATLQQVIKPDAGYNGLSQVTVSGVDSSIDANILPENIKRDVTILGVTGTLSGGEPIIPKRKLFLIRWLYLDKDNFWTHVDQYYDKNEAIIPPAIPTHIEGKPGISTSVTFESWNTNITNLKATHSMCIGALYNTDDGLTHIFIKVPSDNYTVTATLQVNMKDYVTQANCFIDYGDGDKQTVTAPSRTLSTTHVYNKGLHEIKINAQNDFTPEFTDIQCYATLGDSFDNKIISMYFQKHSYGAIKGVNSYSIENIVGGSRSYHIGHLESLNLKNITYLTIPFIENKFHKISLVSSHLKYISYSDDYDKGAFDLSSIGVYDYSYCPELTEVFIPGECIYLRAFKFGKTLKRAYIGSNELTDTSFDIVQDLYDINYLQELHLETLAKAQKIYMAGRIGPLTRIFVNKDILTNFIAFNPDNSEKIYGV